jgi:hypothetical protein
MTERIGAQLILWDNFLLVHPDNLPTSFYVPYVVKTITNNNEVFILHGMFQHKGPGANLKFKLFDNKNKVVGDGTYSMNLLQAAFDAGSFKMMYYPLNSEIQGEFITKRVKLTHSNDYLRISKGSAELPDGSKITFITGISIDHIKDYGHLFD